MTVPSLATMSPLLGVRKRTDRRSRSFITAIAIIGLGAPVTVVALWPTTSVRQAEIALAEGRLLGALNLSVGELQQQPKSSRSLLIAGQAALGLQELDLALTYLMQIPEDDPVAMSARATLALHRGHAGESERWLRRMLELDPGQAMIRTRLAQLLFLEGRDWEARTHLPALFQSGSGDIKFLVMASLLANGESTGKRPDARIFAEGCRRAVPDDPLPLLFLAQQDWRQDRLATARATLEQIVERHPSVMDAQALLGRILAETGERNAFGDWQRRLPARADEHPGVWFARGLQAQRQSQTAAAARCFWETLRRHPQHLPASHQLSHTLAQLQRPEDSALFAEHASRLRRTLRLLDDALMAKEPPDLREAVDLLEATGRLWEAAAWCQFACDQDARQTWAIEQLRRLSSRLAGMAELTDPALSLASRIDLSSLSLSAEYEQATPAFVSQAERPIRFADEAAERGLDFVYHNGATSLRYESFFEMDGGGVAVLDYDGDGWPDLYFTQGGPLPGPLFGDEPADAPIPPQRDRQDRLFRNRAGGGFEDVTTPSRLGDEAYGQGVSVGDFDNDGFPDLYVANVGPNRFYRNNGDGTFSDVTRVTTSGGDEWSSSVALADLNGDGLPDLYVVNYVEIAPVFERRCVRKGTVRCTPIDIPAAHDRLYLNLGDGRFEEVTQAAGIRDEHGRGLGIVVADFDGSRRLSLFISNDATPNFFFRNATATAGAAPQFEEASLFQGLALDENGSPTSSMGVAVGDANGDGLPDLFITNFYRESNTLYVQQPDRTFAVQTRAANLRDGSFSMLGWGTQFVDADLDSDLDLLIANGHVHVPNQPGTPYRMPAQFYRNRGSGRFELVPSDEVGSFFAEPRLGRSLARLDWNRDGRDDACVSHLDSPVALLTNRTPKAGHFLSLRFVGTRGSRDAIGTVVRLWTAGRQSTFQLTAGDGFQCSNERRIIVGLADDDRVAELDIDWPGGTTQTWRDVAADQELLVIEGNRGPIILTPASAAGE